MKRWSGTLAVLILSLLCTTASAQISVLDSNSVRVDLEEFRRIIMANIKASTLEKIHTLDSMKIGYLEGIIADKDSIIAVADDNTRILTEQMEEQRPSWLDRFYIGFIGGVVTVVGILIVTP